MLKKLTMFSTALTVSFVIAAAACADVPLLMSYQGRVTDLNGVPIADGSYNMTFGLFTTDTLGVAVWTETQLGVAVENGLFSVNLGASAPLVITDFNQSLWLEVTIGVTTYSPRHRVVSAGYALGIPDNAVTAAKIKDGEIANADISAAAAIADTKLAQITTAGKVSESALTGTNWTDLTDGGLTALHQHDASTLTGVVHLAPAAADADASTNPSIYINKTGLSGNLAQIQVGGVNKFTVGYDGTIDTASVDAASMVDGAALTEIADDDGAGSGLDADLLDGYDWTTVPNVTDIWVNETGDTMTGDLVMSTGAASPRIDFYDDVNEKILLSGAAGATTTYSIGIEASAQYYKTYDTGFYRWYFGENADGGLSENMELDSDSLNFNNKEAIRYSDTWLRLNQASGFTSGTYTPGLFRADGGYQVDGYTMIDSAGRYYYNSTDGLNYSVNKWGGANTSGFGIDALNSGDWDFLVYEDNIYLQYANAGAGVYVGGTIYDYNDTIVNIGEDLAVAGDVNVGGWDIEMNRGDSSYIHRLGRVSFDWTAGTYNDSSYHGIESENEAGVLADSLRINSYSDIINTIDSNLNSVSYFKVQKESIGNGTDLLTLDESGNLWVLGDITSSNYATLDGRYVNVTGDTMTGRLGQSSSGFHAATKDDLTTRTDSGYFQTSTASTLEAWPEDSTWYHLLSSTHTNDANYYAMQFAADFFNSNDLFYRSSNCGITTGCTTGWNRIWHQGNDGAGSGLDADLLDGYDWGTVPNATDIWVNESGDTMTGDLVMSTGAASPRIDFYDDVNEKILLYGAAGAVTTYSIGIEGSTQYYKANGIYRWYISENADGGLNENMELDSDSLNFNNKDTIGYGDGWLRLNNAGSYTSGIWFSGMAWTGGYLGIGSNGGSTTSNVYINGGAYDAVNDVYLDGSAGTIWARNNVYVSMGNTTGNGLVLSDDGGIYDRNDGYASLAFSSGIDIEDAQDTGDHLTILFNDSYPEVWGYVNGAATLVEFRTGMYNNGGTFYSQNVIESRSYIQNDSANYNGRVRIEDAMEVNGDIYIGTTGLIYRAWYGSGGYTACAANWLAINCYSDTAGVAGTNNSFWCYDGDAYMICARTVF
ncbi:MAG: hypothetical protein AB1742_00770 [bacterium]